MKVHDIEKYLTGEMSPEEGSAFEAEMARDPELAKEVMFLRQLTEDIETSELDKRVRLATKDITFDGQGYSKFPGWAILLLLGLFAGIFYFLLKENNSSHNVSHPLKEASQADSLESSPPKDAKDIPAPREPEKSIPQPSMPIAQVEADETNPNKIPAPQLRGQATPADTDRQALLNSVWYTRYPVQNLDVGKKFSKVDEYLRQRDFSKSYARLQLLERKMAANDTLIFLKAYCLLEQGEGSEALRYFDQIKNKNLAGEDLLEWYRGLAYLLVGDDEKSKEIFSSISATPKHTFKSRAQNVLIALQ